MLSFWYQRISLLSNKASYILTYPLHLSSNKLTFLYFCQQIR